MRPFLHLLPFLWIGLAVAQAQDPPAGAVEAAEVTTPQEPPPPLPAAAPKPGEEVMRPTKLGMRLTPQMVRGFTRIFVGEELKERLDLSEQQQRQITDITSRQSMELARQRQGEIQPLLESLFEGMIAGEGRMTPEQNVEFAKKVQPLVPAARQYYEEFEANAGEVLEPEQRARLHEFIEDSRKDFDRFAKRMEAWASGEETPSERTNPFDEPRNRTPDGAEPDAQSEETIRRENMRNARRVSRWQMRSALLVNEWPRFLAEVGELFGFDDAQKAAGEHLRSTFQSQADEIMTDAWKSRLRSIHTQRYFRWMVQNEVKVEVWLYHLQRQEDELLAPIKDLDRAFRESVLALSTAAQRTAAAEKTLADLRERGLTEAESAQISAMFTNLAIPPAPPTEETPQTAPETPLR